MLEQLRDGDVVTVTKYDRLARSLTDSRPGWLCFAGVTSREV